MGDRGNIKVYQDEECNEAVYLYTHGGGSQILKILQAALSKKKRWDDPPYLTRIIFCEMIKGDTDSSTGYGISTRLCDNEHTVLGVDCERQVVLFEERDGTVKDTVSFEDFINGKFEIPDDLDG